MVGAVNTIGTIGAGFLLLFVDLSFLFFAGVGTSVYKFIQGTQSPKIPRYSNYHTMLTQDDLVSSKRFNALLGFIFLFGKVIFTH